MRRTVKRSIRMLRMKKMLLEGSSIAEIAKECKLKESTTRTDIRVIMDEVGQEYQDAEFNMNKYLFEMGYRRTTTIKILMDFLAGAEERDFDRITLDAIKTIISSDETYLKMMQSMGKIEKDPEEVQVTLSISKLLSSLRETEPKEITEISVDKENEVIEQINEEVNKDGGEKRRVKAIPEST